jgi:hypothetical protein
MKDTDAPSDDYDAKPTDPQFQFLMLLVARKARNELLESLARDWLAESGIHVVFTDEASSQTGEFHVA